MSNDVESEHDRGRADQASLWFPASVLGAVVWGAVNFTLSAYGIINGKRDQILDLIAKCGACPDMILGPVKLYFSNLLPLSVGMCLVFCILSFVLLRMPYFIEPKEQMRKVRWFFAALPIYCLLAFASGAVFDAVIIYTHL